MKITDGKESILEICRKGSMMTTIKIAAVSLILSGFGGCAKNTKNEETATGS